MPSATSMSTNMLAMEWPLVKPAAKKTEASTGASRKGDGPAKKSLIPKVPLAD